MKKVIFLFATIMLLIATSCNNSNSDESLGVCTVIKKLHIMSSGILRMKSSAGDTISVSGVLDNVFLNVRVGDNLEVMRNVFMGNYYVVNHNKNIPRNQIGNCRVIKKIGKGNETGYRALKVVTPGDDTIFVPAISARVFLNTTCGDSVLVKVDQLLGGYFIPDKK